MDLPIGNTFKYEGVILEVVEQGDRKLCKGCFFKNVNCSERKYYITGNCCVRADDKQVIFKEV